MSDKLLIKVEQLGAFQCLFITNICYYEAILP
jgi:hypothetical protein